MVALVKYYSSPEELIRKLKIPGTYKGYALLGTGIRLALADEDSLDKVTERLYPAIAWIHGTSIYCVQKNLRKVIDVCWENGGQGEIERIFGLHYENRPVTEVFIDLLTNHLRKYMREDTRK